MFTVLLRIPHWENKIKRSGISDVLGISTNWPHSKVMMSLFYDSDHRRNVSWVSATSLPRGLLETVHWKRKSSTELRWVKWMIRADTSTLLESSFTRRVPEPAMEARTDAWTSVLYFSFGVYWASPDKRSCFFVFLLVVRINIYELFLLLQIITFPLLKSINAFLIVV